MKNTTELTVKTCYEENKSALGLKLLNSDSGLKKIIKDHDLCRPGLLLSGFTKIFAEKKIQVFGKTEISYLAEENKSDRKQAFERLMKADIPCLIVAHNGKIDKELLRIADKTGISIFACPSTTFHIYQILHKYLSEKFAPSTSVHGTLVDVYGVGILLTGRSGIGKSEIALDLVERGHRLVADDVVTLKRTRVDVLIGTSQEILKSMLEIRGVGLIDVWSMFGISAIRIQKRVEVEVQLEDHKKIDSYDRLGIDDEFKEYLDVKIPLIHLPIFPGKNVTVIAEVIALKIMQRIYGMRPEKDFMQKLGEKIKENDRIRKYLAGDVE